MLKIKCPNCEREYLPGEIYIPKYFTGEPINVQRDEQGKILGCSGIQQDLNEQFQCDNCDCEFEVKATIKFDVKKAEEGIKYSTRLDRE